jgi:hypothetical protein
MAPFAGSARVVSGPMITDPDAAPTVLDHQSSIGPGVGWSSLPPADRNGDDDSQSKQRPDHDRGTRPRSLCGLPTGGCIPHRGR